eukprot:gene838-biopygen12013
MYCSLSLPPRVEGARVRRLADPRPRQVPLRRAVLLGRDLDPPPQHLGRSDGHRPPPDRRVADLVEQLQVVAPLQAVDLPVQQRALAPVQVPLEAVLARDRVGGAGVQRVQALLHHPRQPRVGHLPPLLLQVRHRRPARARGGRGGRREPGGLADGALVPRPVRAGVGVPVERARARALGDALDVGVGRAQVRARHVLRPDLERERAAPDVGAAQGHLEPVPALRRHPVRDQEDALPRLGLREAGAAGGVADRVLDDAGDAAQRALQAGPPHQAVRGAAHARHDLRPPLEVGEARLARARGRGGRDVQGPAHREHLVRPHLGRPDSRAVPAAADVLHLGADGVLGLAEAVQRHEDHAELVAAVLLEVAEGVAGLQQHGAGHAGLELRQPPARRRRHDRARGRLRRVGVHPQADARRRQGRAPEAELHQVVPRLGAAVRDAVRAVAAVVQLGPEEHVVLHVRREELDEALHGEGLRAVVHAVAEAVARVEQEAVLDPGDGPLGALALAHARLAVHRAVLDAQPARVGVPVLHRQQVPPRALPVHVALQGRVLDGGQARVGAEEPHEVHPRGRRRVAELVRAVPAVRDLHRGLLVGVGEPDALEGVDVPGAGLQLPQPDRRAEGLAPPGVGVAVVVERDDDEGGAGAGLGVPVPGAPDGRPHRVVVGVDGHRGGEPAHRDAGPGLDVEGVRPRHRREVRARVPAVAEVDDLTGERAEAGRLRGEAEPERRAAGADVVPEPVLALDDERLAEARAREAGLGVEDLAGRDVQHPGHHLDLQRPPGDERVVEREGDDEGVRLLRPQREEVRAVVVVAHGHLAQREGLAVRPADDGVDGEAVDVQGVPVLVPAVDDHLERRAGGRLPVRARGLVERDVEVGLPRQALPRHDAVLRLHLPGRDPDEVPVLAQEARPVVHAQLELVRAEDLGVVRGGVRPVPVVRDLHRHLEGHAVEGGEVGQEAVEVAAAVGEPVLVLVVHGDGEERVVPRHGQRRVGPAQDRVGRAGVRGVHLDLVRAVAQVDALVLDEEVVGPGPEGDEGDVVRAVLVVGDLLPLRAPGPLDRHGEDVPALDLHVPLLVDGEDLQPALLPRPELVRAVHVRPVGRAQRGLDDRGVGAALHRGPAALQGDPVDPAHVRRPVHHEGALRLLRDVERRPARPLAQRDGEVLQGDGLQQRRLVQHRDLEPGEDVDDPRLQARAPHPHPRLGVLLRHLHPHQLLPLLPLDRAAQREPPVRRGRPQPERLVRPPRPPRAPGQVDVQLELPLERRRLRPRRGGRAPGRPQALQALQRGEARGRRRRPAGGLRGGHDLLGRHDEVLAGEGLAGRLQAHRLEAVLAVPAQQAPQPRRGLQLLELAALQLLQHRPPPRVGRRGRGGGGGPRAVVPGGLGRGARGGRGGGGRHHR